MFIEIIKDLGTSVFFTYLQIAPYLLIGLIFAGLLHIIISKDMIIEHLGNNDWVSAVKAALLGVPLPLCSCGVIPTALHLRKEKASEGATLSFLISTPQTGIDSILPTYGMLGPIFAVFRPLFALITGIFGGLLANRLLINTRPIGESPVINCVGCDEKSIGEMTISEKIKKIFTYAFGDFIDDISVHLLIGIVLAGAISYLVPDHFFVQYGGDGFVGMILMALLGIPLYVCATSSIPIAATLILKGISPGAAFVFLVAGPATNAATITLITRVMGKKAAILYLSVIGISALSGGLLLNFIYKYFDNVSVIEHVHLHDGMSLFTVITSFLLFIALAVSFYRKGSGKMKNHIHETEGIKGNIFRVEGMTCHHCASHVKNAVLSVSGVENAEIDLNGKKASVQGNYSIEEVIQSIREAGYEASIIK